WMLEDAKQSALVRVSFKDSTVIGIEVMPLAMNRSSKMLQIAESISIRDEIFDRLGVRALPTDIVQIKVFPETK
ncbi:MAG: hypothetical protein Q7U31_09755, partial [Anaerolineaceae bacterium]|nr:hypothetical protein [Anaerolineaceae bacterium]